MPSTVGTLVLTFSVAVVLNYLWELTQAPLYVGLERYDPAIFWHCFVASVGDGVMVVLIIAVGAGFLFTDGIGFSGRVSPAI